MATEPRLDAILDDVVHGRLSRREIVRRAVALGVSLPALAALLRERAAAQDAAVPPDAPARPKIFALPGGFGADPYAWLEDPTDPEVIAYLEAENAYTDAVMAPTEQLQETLYQEMIGRIKQTDASVATPWNGYLYYTRTEEGKDYPILCRKQGDINAPEEVLVDLNAIAGEYLALGYWIPSPDNRHLAYELDPTGEELFTIHVLDMETGQEVDRLPESTTFEWANDSRTLFYCKQDVAQGTGRPYALHRHALGTDPADDPLLFQEDDEEFWLGTLTSKDRAYFFLYSGAFDTTEVHYLPNDQPTSDLKLFVPRQPGVLYTLVEHHGDEFLVLTDGGAPNFKLMAAPEADPAPSNWREVVPHREDVLIEYLDVFERHLVLYGREDGFSQIWIRDPASGQTTPLAFPEAIYTAYGGQNWEFATPKLRIIYSSPVTPWSDIEVDMATEERTVLKQDEVIGGHDPDAYATERLFAAAADGTQVPISLVYRREGPAGPRPMRLDGYGAYGSSTNPEFVVNRLALLDRGVTIAIAHVRGGAELGRHWWEEGRLLTKRNTFSDFIACAEHVIAEGHTAPDRLSILGGSAGGLLMGVAATERPDLFRAVVADVPAVELIGLLLRSDIGPGNWSEFGDPNDPTELRYMRTYAPYETVRARAYPTMLVTGGLNDPRVPYWAPAKWVAKLRDVATGDNLLLLRTEMESGHFGASGFYDFERETARLYAFLLLALGMAGAEPGGAAPAPRAAKRPGVAAAAHRPTRRVASPLVRARGGRPSSWSAQRSLAQW